MKASTQWALLLAIVAVLAGIGFGLKGPADRPQVSALWLEHPRGLTEFNLQDHRQQPFTQDSLRDRWTLVFIGYTSCPDVCPTTLSDLARLYPKLEQSLGPEPVEVVLLSVDPARDTTERLAQYIEFFRPGFKAVTGEHSQLLPFTRALGLVYALVDDPDGDYLVDHSADLALINPDGQLEALFRPAIELGRIPKVSMAQLEQDLPKILAWHTRL